MNRLTKKIEDLEKKNQELCIDLGAYQNENENLVKDIEKYWKLEQELGCPLEVVFKALKDGIIYEEESEKRELMPNLMFLRFDNYDEEVEEDYFLMEYDLPIVKLKDYQKTWWLKGEKDE